MQPLHHQMHNIREVETLTAITTASRTVLASLILDGPLRVESARIDIQGT